MESTDKLIAILVSIIVLSITAVSITQIIVTGDATAIEIKSEPALTQLSK